MGKDDALEVAVAVISGAIGLAVLAEILKPKCPICKAEIQKDAPVCQSCGTPLRWH